MFGQRHVESKRSDRQQSFRQRQHCISQNFEVPGESRRIRAVDVSRKFVGHCVQRKPSLKPHTHREVPASLLWRCANPDQPRAGFEQFELAFMDAVGATGNLPCPKRSVECLVNEPWQFVQVCIERFNQAKHSVIKLLYQLDQRLVTRFIHIDRPTLPAIRQILKSVILA